MRPKIKVLLAVPELEDLGVQHVLLSLMRHWDSERFYPTKLLHKRIGAFADQFPPEFSSIQVDERIADIRGARIALRLWGYARIFREVRPDAVISFVPYSNLACAWGRALSGVDFGLAVSEHAHVTASMQDTEALTGQFFWVYRRAFPRVYNQQADLVTCVAEESRRDLVDNHGIVASRTRLIHETADFDEVRSSGSLAADHPWFEDSERAKIPIIVNVGRLCSQKRQDVLLQGFRNSARQATGEIGVRRPRRPPLSTRGYGFLAGREGRCGVPGIPEEPVAVHGPQRPLGGRIRLGRPTLRHRRGHGFVDSCRVDQMSERSRRDADGRGGRFALPGRGSRRFGKGDPRDT